MNFKIDEVLIVCPVYNEAHHLELLVQEINSEKFIGDFLFINSGSNDRSLEIIKNSGQNFLSLDENYGVGNVIMEGIKYANLHKYKVICLIAGNSKMRPKYINKILNPILFDNYDFVQGSRYLDIQSTKNMPLFRKLIIPILSKTFSKIYKVEMTDATCGFRAFKLSLANNAGYDIYADWLKKYAFEPYFYSNVLLDKKVKSIEVAISMDYPDKAKKIKYTKIKPFIDYPSLFFPYIYAFLKPKKFNI